ncbi:NADPH:quinone reductase [Streptomyces sp. NBRC 110028]|uniref:NADPH:quinone reductase n=1 Tax=Streptomyces sp. NBRC 110028 TaxID=1621260 RepID=UPI0006E1566E|nr:NADPH:quinone reductase [Streptomyces sp. NBRC 110028]
MTAAYITGFGGADDIRTGPLPRPVPGPGEALVRVGAVAANHVDTFVRSGAYTTEVPFPFVIGRDLVGTVESPAEAPAGTFAPGDRVWCNSLGHDGRQGSFAQYAAVPVDRLFSLPAGVDPVAAVSVLHTAGTAYLGLFREARLRAGETVLVEGAGGGVGSAVVQLATAAGARVIAVDRAENAQWCRDCGADQVLDRADPKVHAAVRRLAPDGVDVLWDCSGRHDLETTIPLLARGGRVVLMAGLRARAVLPVGAVYARDISLHGFVISNASVADLAEAAGTINRELASGRLRGRVRARLPLTEAPRAHRLLEGREGGAGGPGRIVLIP